MLRTTHDVAEPKNVSACCASNGEISRTIELKWKPGEGGGLEPLYNAKIDGEGELDSMKVSFSGGLCHVTKTPPTQQERAKAKLTTLEWEYPDDPASPGWAQSGYPVQLAIAVDLGLANTNYTAVCPNVPSFTFPYPFDSPQLYLALDRLPSDKDEPEKYPRSVQTGWEFTSLNPFRAHVMKTGSGDNGISTTSGELELTLNHTPQ